MGWKGAIRSARASMRAAERAATRQQKALERHQKEELKLAELQEAAEEADRFEAYLAQLLSIHKKCRSAMSWRVLADATEPTKPIKKHEEERRAKLVKEAYRPGLVDRWLGREDMKRRFLVDEVFRARQRDDARYAGEIRAWEENCSDWRQSRDLAEGVLRSNHEAILEAIRTVDPFSDLQELGSEIQIDMGSSGILEATILVHSDEVIPRESKTLLRSGRLSVKGMPKSRFHELFQDYVCGCVLRMANELFAAVPVDTVVVTAADRILNRTTGHLEKKPIVSALISRESLTCLDLDRVDPSDAMENFVHRMRFRKTMGFDAVEPLDPQAL